MQGMAVLRLNGLVLRSQAGGTVLLYSLLQAVVQWAERGGVPIEAAAWQEAQQVLDDGRSAPHTRCLEVAGSAIVELFTGFRAPVLVLLDELQALLQPTDARGEMDLSDAVYIRDVVLRRVLVESPPTVLWAVTGSSMSLVWTALAAMPPNGVAPLLRIVPVHLPSAFPPSLMRELVDHTQRRLGLQEDVAEQLLNGSGASPALYTDMAEAWHSTPRATDTDVGAFIASYMRGKMLEEVQKEWTLSLAHMADVQRSGVLDLASDVPGAQIEDMGNGIWHFLEPHLQQTRKGRYFLKDRFQRQLLRAAIDRGGKVRSNWSGLQSGLTLATLEWGWRLMQLGEVADYLLGMRRSRGKVALPEKVDIGIGEFRGMLQGLAGRAVERLPVGVGVAGRWEALGAFTQVLDSPYNKGSRSWYESEGRDKKLRSDLEFLVFFLRLSRDALAQQKPWDGPDLANVEVVMALPRLVGMGVEQLSETVRDGMSDLAPVTIRAAAEAAAVEDRDGDGGQGDSGRGGAVAAPAIRGRGSATGSGLGSCTSSTSRATALGSGACASLSKAGRAWLGRPWPGRVVPPAPARIRSARVTVAKHPPLLFI